MNPVTVLDGPFAGTYRSVQALLERTGLTGDARYQSLRKIVIGLSSGADGPRRNRFALTGLELDEWLTRTPAVALQVLDGPFQGIYPTAWALAERLAPGSSGYKHLNHWLRPLRSDPVRSRQRPLPLTDVELQSFLARPRRPRRPRCCLRVLDGPHAGEYPTRRVLRDRAATSDSVSYCKFTARLSLLLEDPARRDQRPQLLTATELEQCLTPRTSRRTRTGHSIRVAEGPHARYYRSRVDLYRRAATSGSVSYCKFAVRLRLLLEDPARAAQRPPSLTAAELDRCLSPLSEVPASARAIRVTAGPHAGQYPSCAALHRHLADSVAVDLHTFYLRLRGRLRAAAAVPQDALPITADELSALCLASPPRRRHGGSNPAAVEVVDGPFAGRYESVTALFDALPVASRASRHAFVTRCASLRYARSLRKHAPLVLTHSELTAAPSRGRRSVGLRVISGPYAGNYASISKLCQALLPATSLRQAMLSNRVTRLLLCVQHRDESRTLPVITGEEVDELLMPRFCSDQELRVACMDALRLNPTIDAATLQSLIGLREVRPVSLARLTYHLAEARREARGARAA